MRVGWAIYSKNCTIGSVLSGFGFRNWKFEYPKEIVGHFEKTGVFQSKGLRVLGKRIHEAGKHVLDAVRTLVTRLGWTREDAHRSSPGCRGD